MPTVFYSAAAAAAASAQLTRKLVQLATYGAFRRSANDLLHRCVRRRTMGFFQSGDDKEHVGNVPW
jgi:hypothetical protein